MSRIESPLDPKHRAQTVSAGGRSVVVNLRLAGDFDEEEKLEELAAAPVAAVAAAQKAPPDVRVEEYGAASERKALGQTERKDEARSFQLSMAGTLLILLLAFGGPSRQAFPSSSDSRR